MERGETAQDELGPFTVPGWGQEADPSTEAVAGDLDLTQLWSEVRGALASSLPEATFRMWIAPVRPVARRGGTLFFQGPEGVREWVKRRYEGLIRSAFEERGLVMAEISFENAPAMAEEPAEGGLRSPNPTHTFDRFVIGPGNHLAHSSALAVAEAPSEAYNPLFLYGRPGLGKTHLMGAVADYLSRNRPDLKILFTNAESFTSDFVETLRREGSAEGFRRKYRSVDVLLVDDIQFLAGKRRTEEEFFHTFNTLHGDQRQIVLSSDRPPDAIATLEDRLRSRFKWGLITDIQPPDFETRLAILQKKGEQSGSSAPPDVLDFIATNITYNIRELEGALIRVNAFATLNHTDLTVELAREILADTIASTKPRMITPTLILDETAAMFGLTVEQLTSKSRTRDLVHARQIGMYVCREMTDLSYPQIAKEFGGRDHTTVIHAYEKVSTRMKDKHKTYEDVTSLIQKILTTG